MNWWLYLVVVLIFLLYENMSCELVVCLMCGSSVLEC